MAVKRIYETFHPEHYDLFIDVNRGEKLITGTSKITGEAQATTVFVNEKYMTISAVKADGQDVPFEVIDADEVIKIELPQAGKTTLEIAYSAPLTDTMMGIYPSYYELDVLKLSLKDELVLKDSLNELDVLKLSLPSFIT